MDITSELPDDQRLESVCLSSVSLLLSVMYFEIKGTERMLVRGVVIMSSALQNTGWKKCTDNYLLRK